MNTIDVIKNKIIIDIPYNPIAIAAIKNISGRKWDDKKKVWTIPKFYPFEPTLIEFIEQFKVEPTQAFIDFENTAIEEYHKFKENSVKVTKEIDDFIMNRKLAGNVKIDDYQKYGINLLINTKGVGITDRQGLGKTVQALIAFEYLKSIDVVDIALVICPKPQIWNWEDVEPKKWDVKVTTCRIKKGMKKIPKSDIYIINYDSLFKRESVMNEEKGKKTSQGTNQPIDEVMKIIKGKRVVLIGDEIHRAKSAHSWTGETIRKLNSDYVWPLTGTPIPEKAIDSWGLLYLLDENIGSRYDFARRFFKIESTPWSQFVIGDFKPGGLEDLQNVIYSRCIRREQTSSERPFLKEKFYCELQGEQKQMYQEMKKEALTYIQGLGEDMTRVDAKNAMAKIIRLEQIASNPATLEPSYTGIPAKFHLIKDILEDAFNEYTEKIIIWCIFRNTVTRLGDWLKEYNPLLLYGDMEAGKVQDQFQKEDKNKILIATMSKGSEGLTLTRANAAYYIEHGNKALPISQSRYRIQRRSQEKQCLLGDLLVEKTVDIKLCSELDKKIEQIHKILSVGSVLVDDNELEINSKETALSYLE
jgi:SNF2 family DNA or RNA helicase